jgi:hypothetical protein
VVVAMKKLMKCVYRFEMSRVFGNSEVYDSLHARTVWEFTSI